MARIRTIKPEFFDDEDLCALSFQHRLCYIGLWTQADKAGRLEDRPMRLKARIFPFDNLDMDATLADLADKGFILRYEAQGRRHLAIRPTSWAKHQRPRQDEPESILPAPDSDLTRGAIAPRGQAEAHEAPESSLWSDESVTAESLGKEGKGRELRRGTDGSPAPRAATEPAVMMFSVVGGSDPEWALTEGQIGIWSHLFPDLDVLAECRKALAWVAADKSRRKTARGMEKFLVRWLTRATDNGGGRSGSQQSRPAQHKPLNPSYANMQRWMAECVEFHGDKCSNQREHALLMAKAGAA